MGSGGCVLRALEDAVVTPPIQVPVRFARTTADICTCHQRHVFCFLLFVTRGKVPVLVHLSVFLTKTCLHLGPFLFFFLSSLHDPPAGHDQGESIPSC